VIRRQIRIERRVSRRYSRVLSEKFLEVVFRQDVRGPELVEELVQGRLFGQQERAGGIEGATGNGGSACRVRRVAGTGRAERVLLRPPPACS
jgi:hypothetical protein